MNCKATRHYCLCGTGILGQMACKVHGG